MSQKTIEGRIGRYVNNTIHGWCAIQGESDSIRIECLVDGISLGELVADNPRKNLIKKKPFLNKPWLCGQDQIRG